MIKCSSCVLKKYSLFFSLVLIVGAIIFLPSIVIQYTNKANANTSNIIGTQNLQDTPKGKIIQCAGNLLLPKTICAGTNENDTIVSPLSGGRIYAKGGDDKVQGLLGGEVTFGGDGNDMIQAGNSSTAIFGNNGNDTLVAEIGPNILTGYGGSMLDGGEGDDRLIGGIHHDIMIGGHGMDTFSCSEKGDIIIDFNPNEDQKSGNCVVR